MTSGTISNFVRAILLAPIFAAVVTGCGGGSDTDGSGAGGGGSDIPAGFANVSGKIVDATGAPIAGAQVRMPFGSTSAWGADTNAAGDFAFQARASDFNNVSPIALVIQKDGYRTKSVFYQNISAGSRYAVPADSTKIGALSAGEYTPKFSVPILHVGDDSFGGQANSQLQVSTMGKGVVASVTTWTADHRSKYSMATIEFLARGVQCSNQFGLAAGSIQKTGISQAGDPGGTFSRYTMNFNVSDFQVGTEVSFFAISAACDPPDLDDFEFTEAFVKFHP